MLPRVMTFDRGEDQIAKFPHNTTHITRYVVIEDKFHRKINLKIKYFQNSSRNHKNVVKLS